MSPQKPFGEDLAFDNNFTEKSDLVVPEQNNF